MSERLPNNLALLYGGFSREVIDQILPGESFHVDDIEFVCKYSPESTGERFFIVKSPALVERYRQLCEQFKGGTIFELGIAEGGSTALIALLAEPRRLVAIDLEPQRLGALDEFIQRRRLAEVIRPHYGIDQSDRARLGVLADTELAGGQLDLVIDDCSHMVAETRSSFDTLFPRLRPGGLFVIEDWNADQVMFGAVRQALSDPESPEHEHTIAAVRAGMASSTADAERRVPLYRLALELVIARASLGDAIRSVTVDEFWITVERGADPLDAATFRLADHSHDYFQLLSEVSSTGRLESTSSTAKR